MQTVAVIIVGTNERKWLERAFSTIFSSSFSGKLEVIYVDNASKDGSVAFVRESFPAVHCMINRRNLGFSGANNRGIARAFRLQADYLFLINPDTATPRKLVETCVTFMETHPDFGAIGPLQAVYGQELEHSSPQLNAWSEEALTNGERHALYRDFSGAEIVEVPARNFPKVSGVLEHAYVQGAALFLRSETLGKTGCFDETYHTFYEEVDLCRRIRWAGFRVGLLMDCFIQHQGGGSTGESLYRRKLMLRNKYYFVMTDPTMSLKAITALLKRWAAHDWRTFSLKAVIHAWAWVLMHVPRALLQRVRHKRLSKNRLLRMVPTHE
jgi:GT2 family glycosyltransferase